MSKIFSRPTDGRHLRTDPKNEKFLKIYINLFYKNKSFMQIYILQKQKSNSSSSLKFVTQQLTLNWTKKKKNLFCILIYFWFLHTYLTYISTQNFNVLHRYKIGCCKLLKKLIGSIKGQEWMKNKSRFFFYNHCISLIYKQAFYYQ